MFVKFYEMRNNMEITNDFFIQKIRVVHRITFRYIRISKLNFTSFISGFCYFSTHFYFRSCVLNNAIESRAHTREETNFARFQSVNERVLHRFAEINIPEDNCRLSDDVTKIQTAKLSILLLL